jgi:hypothetical protein
VLILDPLDSGVGKVIESYARKHGVSVIDYDRLTQGGSRRYYVGFNDVAVGQAMGRGLVSCVSAWGVKKPKVIVMRGTRSTRTRRCTRRATTASWRRTSSPESGCGSASHRVPGIRRPPWQCGGSYAAACKAAGIT